MLSVIRPAWNGVDRSIAIVADWINETADLNPLDLRHRGFSDRRRSTGWVLLEKSEGLYDIFIRRRIDEEAGSWARWKWGPQGIYGIPQTIA